MLRVLAIEGHNNLLATFEHWMEGRDDPTVTAVPFAHQLFDACRDLGAEAKVLSLHQELGEKSFAGITVEHRGRSLFEKRGVAYNAELLRLALSLSAEARRMRADVVMTVGFPPTGLLLPLLAAGHHVIVTHHCVLWPKYGSPQRVQRLLRPLQRLAYRHPRCTALVVSDDIDTQITEIRGDEGPAVVRFFPLFRRALFESIPEPKRDANTFRVGFVGRVEAEKGVFDLLTVAQKLRADGRDVRFDICGEGGSLAELRTRVGAAGLADYFTLHGWCNQQQLRAVLADMHTIVVPTRTDFVEGFNMVVVESLLAGRPVITSATCPALSYVRGDAAIEVGADDVSGYGRAIERLVDDPALYARAQRECARVATPFFEERYSYRAAVTEALMAAAQRRPARAVAPSARELSAMQAAREGLASEQR